MSNTNQTSAVLAAFKAKKTLTPSELADSAGIDLRYTSKFVSYLRFYGHDVSCKKDGRTVVSYTYLGETANVKPIPSGRTKTASVKTKAPKAAKAPKAKSAKSTKAANKPVMTKEEIKKAAAAIQKMRKPKDEVEATFGSSGAVASSFAVDSDWDSVEDIDVRSLVA